MRIFALKYDDKPLFHGLTPENRGTGQVFTFHKNHEEFARMMIMGLFVYVEHLDPGQGRYWFNAEAIELAEGAYWDDKRGVIVAPQDQALSEAVAEGWWETDELVNDHGEDEVPTRPEGGQGNAPAITDDDEMLDHKFDDGKTVGSVGHQLSPRMDSQMIDASAKPDSISAVSFESEHEELQQELAATQEKLRRMEAQIAVADRRSLEASQSHGAHITPPKKRATGFTGTAFSDAGEGP
jgi:hypothetical protein